MVVKVKELINMIKLFGIFGFGLLCGIIMCSFVATSGAIDDFIYFYAELSPDENRFLWDNCDNKTLKYEPRLDSFYCIKEECEGFECKKEKFYYKYEALSIDSVGIMKKFK